MARHIDFSHHSEPVKKAAHAIGLDNKRPCIRHGKTFYRPYRNYFTTHFKAHDYTVWMGLFEHGYAAYRHTAGSDVICFWLTRAGLDWLGETLGITIYDEED